MKNREMISPFSWGAAAGALAITIAAFSFGWVVTGSSSEQAVRTAWVDGQASACSALVAAHRKATGDVTELAGYQARDARNTLAKTFAVVLPGESEADARVIRSCSDLLEKASL
ncbi:MAG: hypothetical protein ACREDZ_07015 [Kiloniellales bacterium]